MHEDPVTVLSAAESWELLRSQELGRLAFHLGEEVHITPVNYAVEGDALLFRTAPGSKLLGIVMDADVAFEIDRVEGEVATSVVVRGRARRLEEDEQHRTESVGLRPWVPTAKYEVVEIVPTSVSGRAFSLERPWLHLRPHA